MLPLLKGVRVLEMAVIISGDMASSLVADMGADVIKVEPPPIGDYQREVFTFNPEKRLSHPHLMLNREKRSLSLNLKHEEARKIFFDLMKTSDAVFELSVPGAREALGVDYEACRKIKPDIVYVSLTGYGYTGPYADFPAHGVGPESVVGLAHPVRLADGELDINMWGPPRFKPGDTEPFQGITVHSGPFFAALAILTGLLHKEKTGEGCYLETSLADAGIWMQNAAVFDHFNSYRPVSPWPDVGAGAARYNFYECKDGNYILLMPIEKKFWIRFCDVIARDDLKDRGNWERHMDIGRDDPELEADLKATMKTKTRDEWMELLRPANVPAAPNFTIHELLDDERYVKERELVTTYDHPGLGPITLASNPIKWRGHPFKIAVPAPALGEHNGEILTELGYSESDIAALKEQGALF